MAIPERPDGRVENYLANLIGQETAWEPGNPESRVEEYLDYILKNGTKSEQEMEDDIAALKSIGRYLSLWNGATGKPVTEPKKLPYKYKAGDYYIVSNIGATNYMPSGTQYEGNASSTLDADAKVNDYYVFDGTTWSRLSHSGSGGGAEAFIVTLTEVENVGVVCNKTWKEIKDAMLAGKSVLYSFTEPNVYSDLGPITAVRYDSSSSAPYIVKIGSFGDDNFYCSTENGYPTLTDV